MNPCVCVCVCVCVWVWVWVWVWGWVGGCGGLFYFSWIQMKASQLQRWLWSLGLCSFRAQGSGLIKASFVSSSSEAPFSIRLLM